MRKTNNDFFVYIDNDNDNDNDNDLFYYSDLCYNDFVTSSIN